MNYSVENLKKILKYLLLAAIAIWLVSMLGCNTAKKDFNNVLKAELRNPAQTAKQLNDWRPCIPLKSMHDSAAFKKSMDSIAGLNEFYKTLLDNVEPLIEHDTIKPECEDYAYNELKLKNIIFIKDNHIADLQAQIKNFKPIHDIDTVRDTRQEEIIQKKLEESEAKNLVEFNGRQKAQASADRKQIFINWLLILCIVFGAYTSLSIYRKFAQPKLPI